MLDVKSAESLSRIGHFQKIVSECGDLGRIQRLTSDEHRLILADALAKVGRLEAAAAVVAAVQRPNAPDAIMARCEAVLGWIARERGAVDEATQRLQHSAMLFRASGNIPDAALSSILLFRIVSERQPAQAVGPLLSEARTLVIRAGEPHLSALLHESVARQETQAANYDEARRHLRIAMALVTANPNAWVEQLCWINAFCISVYECDLRSAESELARAAALIDITGTFGPEIRNNQGHLYLHLGRFTKAEELLTKVGIVGAGQVSQSALDGLARLYLATGRLDDCDAILERLRRLQVTRVTSFPYRSSLITTIRLLLRQGNWHEAMEVCRLGIAEAQKIEDRHLLAATSFLQAQVFANLGDSRQAAAALSSASSLGLWSIREHQGSFAYIASDLARTNGFSMLSDLLLERAERIWRDHDNACAEAEFAVPRRSPRNRAISPTNIRHEGPERAIALINAIANAFELSYSPRLVAAEMINILALVGAGTEARVVESRLDHADSPTMESTSSVILGTYGGKRLTLLCPVPDNPVAAAAASDALRIGQSVVALARAREHDRNRAALWPDLAEQEGDALFVAEEMQALLATARRVATTAVPLLITGETGTGKEILAKTIHACSNRARRPFLPFNCSSTPRDMLDSQLFGHRRGAFTGATENFPGVIRAASEGTLFLDEIGDMGLDVQPKLLRFLESGEIHPVGQAQPLRVDVRVIAATNAPLDTLVAEGRFREDLFYRLNIVRLHVPPLRERRVEIPALAAHYLAKHAAEFGKGDLRLAEETMEYLVLYRWPGNVRQLANEMRRLAALAETGAVLMPEHLSAAIASSRRTIPASERALEPTEVVVRLDQPMAAGIQHLERAMMQYALRACGGRLEETAAMLGLSRKGLYLKRQRFGIEMEGPAAAGV